MQPSHRLFPSILIASAAVFSLGLLAVSATRAHGSFEKKFWTEKPNRATRGSTDGTQKSTIYLMQPAEFSTGPKQSVGWRVTLQDMDASTSESIRLSYVKFAADGKSPDLSSTGEIFASTFQSFGRGLMGNIAYRFRFSIGVPRPLPTTSGIGIELAGNAKWPQDGAAIHAQLNLPSDLRRPRVLPPYDSEVWCYESIGNGQVQPLGKRSLDTLDVGGLYIEPILVPFLDTFAYDDTATRPERVTGVDALFPSAQRGDALGMYIEGGQLGSDGFAILYAASALTKGTPIPLNTSAFSLSLIAPDPYPILMTGLDSLGNATVGPLDFLLFPQNFRKFWMQAIILNPFSLEIEATDAVGIRGQ